MMIRKRILVDRVWPRGIFKEAAQLDDWLKEVAPSTELRKWFDHDAEKFVEFKQLKSIKGAVILLYDAKDEKHNNAAPLKEFLEK
ncbi:DUF488 family protein [Macrococcus hajekii]|uniref:DUF488 family protein n=1 Tax=Macrococcus hajekii TaxID=198482 RepID=A0A4R6BK42_9STAP|nr:DUF488 family protein [Macrococcus hajekii]TDM02085.1 DUF488 family protein [Macrococcus hajekii]GGB09973.1 hypothetical protein GCM10007190_17540 [Macrococcus hajekii]